MEEVYLSRRKRLAVFLLSCCAHLAVLILILRLNHETVTYNPDTQDQLANDIKNQLDYQAEILAQSPHEQGATVMLADEPTSTHGDHNLVTPPQDAVKAQPESDSTDTAPTEEPEQSAAMQEEPLPVPAPEKTKTPEKQGAKDTVDKAVPTPQKPQQKSAGSSGSQNITLAQITQGFLKSMYQERGAVPDHELDALTMARQAYTSKVWHILRQSVNAHKRYITLKDNVNTNTVLSLLIRKDGTLLDIKLDRPLASSDVQAIEETIVRAATTTGLYPPIPAQFHSDTITLRFPLNIRGHKGMHSYELNYN